MRTFVSVLIFFLVSILVVFTMMPVKVLASQVELREEFNAYFQLSNNLNTYADIRFDFAITGGQYTGNEINVVMGDPDWPVIVGGPNPDEVGFNSNYLTINDLQLKFDLSNHDSGEIANIWIFDNSSLIQYSYGSYTNNNISITLNPNQFIDGNLHVKFYTTGSGMIAYENPELIVMATQVPIPSSLWLICSGLIGIVEIRRKFRFCELHYLQ
jgi:hypothetical protein